MLGGIYLRHMLVPKPKMILSCYILKKQMSILIFTAESFGLPVKSMSNPSFDIFLRKPKNGQILTINKVACWRSTGQKTSKFRGSLDLAHLWRRKDLMSLIRSLGRGTLQYGKCVALTGVLAWPFYLIFHQLSDQMFQELQIHNSICSFLRVIETLKVKQCFELQLWQGDGQTVLLVQRN